MRAVHARQGFASVWLLCLVSCGPALSTGPSSAVGTRTAAAPATAPTTATATIPDTASASSSATSVPSGSPVLGDPTAVPWADLPVGVGVAPIALPTPTPDPSIARCAASQLRGEIGDGQGAGGQYFGQIIIRRVSGSACVLTDAVTGMTGHFSGGPAVPLTINTHDNRLGGLPSTITPILLAAPSDKAWTETITYPRCDEGPGQKTYGPASDVRLRLRNTGHIPVAAQAGTQIGIGYGCQAHTGPIGVSPLQSEATRPRYPHDPVSDLTVSISAPASVAAGTTLIYTVTLRNPTATAVPFTPCPSYDQSLGSSWSAHSLNCADAVPIPANGKETFVMRLIVKADEIRGPGTLMWGGYKIDYGTLATTQTGITIN